LPVADVLKLQATLTAVDRFAKRKDEGLGGAAEKAKHYRDLIPLERPNPGEQYAFEVDLDVCTGCKACVAACHTMNGLDAGEMWRSVGLLHGGTAVEPVQQTVTTSCHHCMDPACMTGCPVGAYEKDPVTGIVKHLDDQCFGCQYCTLMCPYDAPKYSASRGIVRKCDMCSDRLAHGEAPACVQSCPNEAISIRVVSWGSVLHASQTHTLIPGAADPEQTLPTTVYKTAKAVPENMLPADFYVTSPEHSHLALVIMLTLTQAAAGSFGFGALVEAVWGRPAGSTLAQSTVACIVALVALAASIFHLGRPRLFWRAVYGLRTSWLSREVLVFSVFATLAIGYEASIGWSPLRFLAQPLRTGGSVVGVLGVLASVMVYVATRRKHWTAVRTGVRFFGTSLGLGAAAVLAVGSFSGLAHGDAMASALVWCVAGTTLIKVGFEAAGLRHKGDAKQSVEKRVATVLLGDLWVATRWRFSLGIFAGLGLPLAVGLGSMTLVAFRVVTLAMLVALVAADGLERYLFFRAAPASRMPGGLR
jgi:Fe-S-cluster-containing dehydrogenase component/DMSO reductase anchor subunit